MYVVRHDGKFTKVTFFVRPYINYPGLMAVWNKNFFCRIFIAFSKKIKKKMAEFKRMKGRTNERDGKVEKR